MYPVNIKVLNYNFKCVEAAYQAFKTTNRYDFESFLFLDGYQAKRHGKQIRIRDDWDEIKVKVMYKLLTIKFKDGILLSKLRAVDEPIIEHNHWGDTFWGVCDGVGQNVLGQLLTRIKNNGTTISS